MGLALLWALLLGVPGAPDPWSDDVGLPGYDLSFIPWNDEEPQFRERAVKVYHLSPDLGRLDGGLLVNVTGKGFIAQAATDPKCQFEPPRTASTSRASRTTSSPPPSSRRRSSSASRR